MSSLDVAWGKPPGATGRKRWVSLIMARMYGGLDSSVNWGRRWGPITVSSSFCASVTMWGKATAANKNELNVADVYCQILSEIGEARSLFQQQGVHRPCNRPVPHPSHPFLPTHINPWQNIPGHLPL